MQGLAVRLVRTFGCNDRSFGYIVMERSLGPFLNSLFFLFWENTAKTLLHVAQKKSFLIHFMIFLSPWPILCFYCTYTTSQPRYNICREINTWCVWLVSFYTEQRRHLYCINAKRLSIYQWNIPNTTSKHFSHNDSFGVKDMLELSCSSKPFLYSCHVPMKAPRFQQTWEVFIWLISMI